jgi:hypothetical protein
VHLQNNHVPLALHPLLAPPPPLRAPAPVEEFLLPKALTPAGVRSPLALVRPMTGARDLAAEALHILRPLVYGPSVARCAWGAVADVPQRYCCPCRPASRPARSRCSRSWRCSRVGCGARPVRARFSNAKSTHAVTVTSCGTSCAGRSGQSTRGQSTPVLVRSGS